MPAKQLNRLALTKADKVESKVYKLKGDLSKAQQKTFKVDQQQLRAAKKIFSVQDTLSVELGKDQLLKDENFKVEDFNNDFAYLLAHKAKFAASIKDKATLLDRAKSKQLRLSKQLRQEIQTRQKLIRRVMLSMLSMSKRLKTNTCRK
ncbi:hypothetical protein [Lacticaseibacillus rhamnosus]|uniref:hypothetical protein n=1 Tax=Lacticaseibacillus rhamnosus TaxID=47715 RepID=UPI001CDBD047|nr:hypothetical protein [Lacticaseibacillus rhamnosus]